MDLDTKTPPYLTSDKNSFGYVTVKDRWPIILTGAIDDVHRTVIACTYEEKIKEGKNIVQNLATLKHELQHDRAMIPIVDDGNSDIKSYNVELKALGTPTWFNAPWLFAECYLYRRMSTFFALSMCWKSYDVFSRQKLSTFKSSRAAVIELAVKYKELIVQLEDGSATSKDPEELETAERLLFTEMCEICLWGNATDLSLLTSLTYEDIQKLQGSEARKTSEKRILVNDLSSAYKVLKTAQQTNAKKGTRVDIVLDNAGFELFVDLILAGYLLSAGLATQIVLHPKSIPWFVSDVLPADFAVLLNALADPQTFFSTPSDEDKALDRVPEPLSEQETSQLSFLFNHWRHFHQEGQLLLRPHPFWTSASSFWRLPGTEPKLFHDLQMTDLIIFKGDLNYRKLTGDVYLPSPPPFTQIH